EETLFPNAMSINSREELEEERRLFYVAVTRAKARLVLSFANTRYKFGQLQQNDPSRFIDEIPDQFLDRSYAGQAARQSTGSSWSMGAAHERMQRGFPTRSNDSNLSREPKKPSYATAPAKPQLKEHVPSANFISSDTSDLQMGQKVEHQKFGFGEIKKLEGASHNPIATIQFEQNGEKKIMLNYAKLRIVPEGER
ncbi:MAG TPA: 3'-5' exonuclease, partial [Ferruginibacter sp.]|nr:3'-5' exonuclease [Ferruginibacter sp.]